MDEKVTEITPERQALLDQADLELRGKKCMAEIEASCKKYGFTLQVGAPSIMLMPAQPTTPQA
jgi:hypothetical protein